MLQDWIPNGKIYQKIEAKVETILSQYGFSFACEEVIEKRVKYYTRGMRDSKHRFFGFTLYTKDLPPEVQITEWIALFDTIVEDLNIKEKIRIQYQPALKKLPTLIEVYSLNPTLDIESVDLEPSILVSLNTMSKELQGQIYFDKSKQVLCFRLDLTSYILNQSKMSPSSRTMILAHFSYHKLGIKLSQYYRREGLEIITQIFEDDFVLRDWIEYAKKYHIGGIFLIDNLIHIKVINIETPDRIQRVDISQFTF